MSLSAINAYRLAHRSMQLLVIDVVFDPLDGREERVCYIPTCDRTKKLILLRHSEVDRVINLFYE